MRYICMMSSGATLFAMSMLAVNSAAAAKHLEPLPVAASAEKPVILLEAEPLKKDTPAIPEVNLYGGTVLSNDAQSCAAGDSSLLISQPGHAKSTTTISFTLDPRPKAGKYAVWTAFTVGGVAANTFTIRAGKDLEHLSKRVAFSQKNAESWKTAWQKGAGAFVLFPSDAVATIEVSGMASDKKILDAFLLEPLELYTETMDEKSGELRSHLTSSADPIKATRRLYVLEGSDIKAMDELLHDAAQESLVKLLGSMDVRYLMGTEAEETAQRIGLKELPALVVTDENFKILGMAGKGATTRGVENLLKEGMGSTPLPPVPDFTPTSPKPFVDGSPAEWLTVGCWAGPSGLSLQGIDAEKTIRPCADDPCMVIQFDTSIPTQWRALPQSDAGAYVIESPTKNYVWPKGTAHAFLYFKVVDAVDAVLQVAQSGVSTAGWLDGEPLQFTADGTKSAAAKRDANAAKAVGRTDQGNTFEVKIEGKEGPVAAPLSLRPGWHRLLLKLVMQHKDGETFQFSSRFTDTSGTPLQALGSVVDPAANLAAHAAAQRLVPYLRAGTSVSLPRPGDPLKLNMDFKYFPLTTPSGHALPMSPLRGKLLFTLTDYDGKELARRETTADLPGKVEVDFGPAPAAGYYAVHTTLLAPDGGALIATYPPDGFSVIKGTAAQAKRKNAKKMSTTYYFLANNPDRLHRDGTPAGTFEWMNRMGIYRNVGSSPGFNKELWDMAKDRGVILCADFWDIHNSETPERKMAFAKETAPYERWYKSFNEVDIVPTTRGTPEQWVKRTKIEYEAVKAARPDGYYIGGSLVRVGADAWFEECLKLGLDRYQDAWDVHAYPKLAPVLGGSLSNSPTETELGGPNPYTKHGRAHPLPFWVGETGARACHGTDARRWQAETVAKMTAWANSRTDVPVISFLVPFTYSRNAPTKATSWMGEGGTEGDIQAGHHPAEAAYYTASALIDGLPYRRVDTADHCLQAAYFGETLMLWTTGTPVEYELTLDAGEWVFVDVVGHATTHLQEAPGTVRTSVSSSPVFLLRKKRYEELTAL